jgi:hypothetical protein
MISGGKVVSSISRGAAAQRPALPVDSKMLFPQVCGVLPILGSVYYEHAYSIQSDIFTESFSLQNQCHMVPGLMDIRNVFVSLSERFRCNSNV